MKTKHLRRLVLAGTIALSPAILAAIAVAQISVSIGIPLPPPIVFAAPPELIVLPGSYVYVAPDLAEDVYFVDGWWWRPWQGHWYRSQSYNDGWSYYENAPSFYGSIHHGWRDDYRQHRWQGHAWNYERMPQQRVSSNWSSWKSNDYWRSHQSWGVPEMQQRQRTDRPDSRHDSMDRRAAPDSPRDSGRQANRPRQPMEQHHASPPQHRSAPPQHRSAPPREQRAEHHAGRPDSASHRSAQPAGNKGNSSQGHGGKSQKNGEGAPDQGKGHGKK